MTDPKSGLAFIHYLEYAAIRTLAGVLRILPLPLAVALGRCLGAAFYALDRRHRQRVITQAQWALGETDPAEARKIAWRMYRHFGTMLAEVVRLRHLTRENIDQYVDWGEIPDTVSQILAAGKGLIYVTGHIGNWELTGYAFHLKGICTGAIARPLDNPLLDDYITSLRTHRGQQVWDKFGALRRVVRILREGGACAMLVDQDAGQNGEFIPFFGREASTITTAVDLAMRTGAPLLVGGTQRTGGPMRFIARIGKPIRVNPEAEKTGERRRLLRAMNADLEKLIRLAPEQWLWLHRRWKTRPPGEK